MWTSPTLVGQNQLVIFLYCINLSASSCNYVPHESIYKDNGESYECVNSDYEYSYEILIFTNFIYRLWVDCQMEVETKYSKQFKYERNCEII